MPVKLRQPSDGQHSNQLLAQLPEDEYLRLAPLLDTIGLPGGYVLHALGAPLERVYFPSGGVCSITCAMFDGESVDVAVIGNEGIVGIGAVLRGTLALHDAVVRIPNQTQALPLAVFSREMERGGAFHDTMMHYTQAFIASLTQAAACNALHSIEKRCARCLLDISDRMGRADFVLTQELLATMLGVRRASVTICATDLHHAGLIDYGHRRVVIRDRSGLEGISCECYAVVKGLFSRLLP